MKNKRYFPCPICKGKGHLDNGQWEEVASFDLGTLSIQISPDTPCGYCYAEGMIEIGGKLHKRKQAYNRGEELLNKRFNNKDWDRWYSYNEIVRLGYLEA